MGDTLNSITGKTSITLSFVLCLSLSMFSTIPTYALRNQLSSTSDMILIQFDVETEDSGQYSFVISIPNSLDFNEIRRNVKAAFTEEQTRVLRSAKEIESSTYPNSSLSSEDVSYWALEYGPGLSLHLHFSPIDAINLGTVVALTTLWLGIAAGVISLLTLGMMAKVALVITTYVVGIIAVDYTRMYGVDHNKDNSFDLWFEITWYMFIHVLGGNLWAHTPNYKWRITPVGAWAYERYERVFVMPLSTRGLGGHVGMDVHLK